MRKKQITVILGAVVENNKILMTQRYEPECPEADLKWEIPGGKIDFGEDPKIAIKREIYEETGAIIDVGPLMNFSMSSVWKYDWGEKHVILFCYHCRLLEQKKVKKDHHVRRVSWIPLEKVKSLKTLPGSVEIVEEYSKGQRP